MRIEVNRLNPLELKIHKQLIEASKENEKLTITDAAIICAVSSSKISKFVKKLGFSGYKEYLRFITGKELIKQKKISSEFQRILDFINQFDKQQVDDFAKTIQQYDKILLFGFGPSGICAEYFEYKLNVILDKNIIALSNTEQLEALLNEKTILIIFSVTGQYQSFKGLFNLAKEKNAKALLIMEEYHSSVDIEASEVLFLTKSQQDPTLKPHEKTRTVFFMFIEEVIQTILLQQKE